MPERPEKRLQRGVRIPIHAEELVIDLAMRRIRLEDLADLDHGFAGSGQVRVEASANRSSRIGIGRPPGNMDAADYVLATFRPQEREAIGAAIDQAADLIVRFVEESAGVVGAHSAPDPLLPR